MEKIEEREGEFHNGKPGLGSENGGFSCVENSLWDSKLCPNLLWSFYHFFPCVNISSVFRKEKKISIVGKLDIVRHMD